MYKRQALPLPYAAAAVAVRCTLKLKRYIGQLLLAQTLLAADSPVTVVATGPLTALAWVLDSFPEVSSKIEKVLIMGEFQCPRHVLAEKLTTFLGEVCSPRSGLP